MPPTDRDRNLQHVATDSANLYIDINKQGTGTLTGDVDDKIKQAKAERLLDFKEAMSRKINPAAESTLLTAGQIAASLVEAKILITQVSIYVEESLFKASAIPYITVYRQDILNGKYTVVRQTDYKNVFINSYDIETDENGNISAMTFTFRFSIRQNTLFDFDQSSRPIGQQVSLIDFTKGSLQPGGGGG